MSIDPNLIESDLRYEELKLRAELYSTLYNVALQSPNRKLSNFPAPFRSGSFADFGRTFSTMAKSLIDDVTSGS